MFYYCGSSTGRNSSLRVKPNRTARSTSLAMEMRRVAKSSARCATRVDSQKDAENPLPLYSIPCRVFANTSCSPKRSGTIRCHSATLRSLHMFLAHAAQRKLLWSLLYSLQYSTILYSTVQDIIVFNILCLDRVLPNALAAATDCCWQVRLDFSRDSNTAGPHKWQHAWGRRWRVESTCTRRCTLHFRIIQTKAGCVWVMFSTCTSTVLYFSADALLTYGYCTRIIKSLNCNATTTLVVRWRFDCVVGAKINWLATYSAAAALRESTQHIQYKQQVSALRVMLAEGYRILLLNIKLSSLLKENCTLVPAMKVFQNINIMCNYLLFTK